MSKNYYATPKRPFSEKKFLKNITKWHGVAYQQRDDNLYYFGLENESTRGIDITINPDHIELRNTVLSNHEDYQLTNWAAQALNEEFDCTFRNEDGAQIKSADLIDLANTSELIKRDYDTFRILALNGHETSVFGPYREVYIGKNLIQELESLNSDAAEQLILRIQHIQYHIPKLSGNYLSIETEDGDKSCITLQPSRRTIIIKYDYLMLMVAEDDFILLTNADLNSILPDKWTLLDEYTIDANQLSERKLKALIVRARPLDRSNELK